MKTMTFKKEIYEQMMLIIKEYGVNYQLFIDMIFDYLNKDDLQGLLDHIAHELKIK